jgi:multidrug efflux pump subunit AcrB
MFSVSLCLAGVMPMLRATGTALNVRSLLGIIFIVGIKVANKVLRTVYAQELRHHEGLRSRRQSARRRCGSAR